MQVLLVQLVTLALRVLLEQLVQLVLALLVRLVLQVQLVLREISEILGLQVQQVQIAL